MSLYKKERLLYGSWDGKSEAAKKNKLKEIGMDVRALSSQSGYILLQYTFSNNAICDAEEEEEKKSAL